MKKMPPIEKIYEAFSAIADGRVKMQEKSATVASSDRTKSYNVVWDEDTYRASDSATYWQGYPGYPVIAVLMLQGRLPCNNELVRIWAGINWKQLNLKYKRNYAAAAMEVMEGFKAEGIDVDAMSEAASSILKALGELNITIGRTK